ncbi:unnamed protein product [Dovyalis caffra]|uniref:4-coumarate--CoA ligase n=1 Tax=Dovyalis caffra TaxID=77055 RepID=A0AAV1R4I9_9ROSI|nr:unnamed protein product [Dovyalis caffra]
MENRPTTLIDPKSGFCSLTKTYLSLRPHLQLPPNTASVSTTEYAFSLLRHSSSPPPQATALLDAVTGHRISFHELIYFTETLASSLQNRFRLKKGDTAFILSPNSLHIPILYFSLFSLGVVISPSNPNASEPEIHHQINLSKPVIAFATSKNAHKIPDSVKEKILLDSPEFESIMTSQTRVAGNELERVKVYQSDLAAILYSSGTTGRVKGVLLTHRNFISMVAASHATRGVKNSIPTVTLCTVPYFHAYGFAYCVRLVAMGDTLVSVGRFKLREMLSAIQEYRVSHVALAPPVVVAMVKNVGVVDGYDLSSLEVVACGGAPLTKRVLELFKERFPCVHLAQGYGLTETTARIFGTVGPKESEVIGATGKLLSNCEARIVDPDTGISLPPCSPGELWVRGDTIMKGYIGDDEATAATLDSGGWLRTGDLCYIDKEGFLFFVDRIKELIKCKGYQVAPAELEHLLQSNPDIVEAAVVPYPEEEAGQVPVGFVVRQNGSNIDESKIKDFIARQVAPYKRLERVMFIESLPRNAAGKVLRRELINLALSNAISKL